MVLPVPHPGRLLEFSGDAAPRGMVHESGAYRPAPPLLSRRRCKRICEWYRPHLEQWPEGPHDAARVGSQGCSSVTATLRLKEWSKRAGLPAASVDFRSVSLLLAFSGGVRARRISESETKQ